MFIDGRERYLLAKNYSGNLKLVWGEFHLMSLMTKHTGHQSLRMHPTQELGMLKGVCLAATRVITLSALQNKCHKHL